jgi:hypothetical protein
MERDLVIGTMDTGYATRAVVTVHIEWTPPGGERYGQIRPDGSLSLTASAKRPRAKDIDSGGQMQGELREQREAIDYAPGWSPGKLVELLDVWDTYHLNDMQAGCEHQRALGWTYNEHPAEPCPECGYKMGTEWRTMPVPAEVIEYLRTVDA